MQLLIKIAAGELGVKEIQGEKNEKRIVDYAKEAGFKGITDDETPWCSIFLSWCCMKAGLQRTNRANARSWLSIGKPVNSPMPGDIVIFWRESPESWKGHVGIFIGFSKDREKIFTLGGNQRNSVSILGQDASYLLGFRRLTNEKMTEIPKSTPNLKIGSHGDQVAKLQTILRELEYDCDVNGIFDDNTDTQLRLFQRRSGLEVDGIYGKDTKDYLVSIFQS